MPAHIEPLRGFVVAPQIGSGQIDILLYDNRKPVLFRNGDLVFATPDSVAGIVEVKSNIGNRGVLRDALTSLADDAAMIRGGRQGSEGLFVGLFSYTTDIEDWAGVLEDIDAVATGSFSRVVSHVCLGCSHFSRFWEESPGPRPARGYNTWHAYRLENQAAGYFINNLIATVAGESVAKNHALWFPEPSKELQRIGTRQFRPHNQRLHPTVARRRVRDRG